MSALEKWLLIVADIAPIVLKFIPAAAPVAPFIAPAIQIAEQIPGASGPQKLDAATKIAQVGLQAAQAAGASFDANALGGAVTSAVNAVVAGVNAVHRNTPAA